MYAERQSAPTDLHEGTQVEVATHFTGSWTHGFEVAALHRGGCQVRRISDGAVLPVDFDYADVRAFDAGEHCAVRPVLTRLGERAVQTQPDLANVRCTALVALDVMCSCGACNFAIRPRRLLAPDVVDAITELGPAFPMRYLIERQA